MKTMLSHLYTPTKPAEVQAAFNALGAALHHSGYYVSTPVTGGTRYVAFKNRGLSKEVDKAEYFASVLCLNKRSAANLAGMLQTTNYAVVNPARTVQEGWEEDDYMALWLAVIYYKLVTRVVVNEGWYASQGCVMEVTEALLCNTPVYDGVLAHRRDLESMASMSIRGAISAIEEGRELVRGVGLPTNRHDQALAALTDGEARLG